MAVKEIADEVVSGIVVFTAVQLMEYLQKLKVVLIVGATLFQVVESSKSNKLRHGFAMLAGGITLFKQPSLMLIVLVVVAVVTGFPQV